jgi:hypothetical protein
MFGNTTNIFSIVFGSIGNLLGTVDFESIFGSLTEGLGGFFQALIAPWLGN